MGFSFGNIKVNQKKSAVGLQLTDRTVLADTSLNLGTDVNVLVDYLYPQETINVLMDWLRYQGLLNCKVIYVLNCIASRAQAEKDGIIKFYRQNKVDLYAHMIPKAPVITVGPALYSLLCEDDIYPSHTEQAIFGKTNFFFSKDFYAFCVFFIKFICALVGVNCVDAKLFYALIFKMISQSINKPSANTHVLKLGQNINVKMHPVLFFCHR